MSTLLLILVSIPAALSNILPIRASERVCNQTEILCTSTTKGPAVSTKGWLANASTIHGIFGPERTVTIPGTPVGELVALCCPIRSTECGLLMPGNVPLCYKPLVSGSSFSLSDGSEGFVLTGDFYNYYRDNINLVTGDYTYVNGTTGNWFVDRGQRPHAAAPNTTCGGVPTATGDAPMLQTSQGAGMALSRRRPGEVVGVAGAAAVLGLLLLSC